MELTDYNFIMALLARHGFHFSKAKGQNFLIASWVPERIAAESGADKRTGVLEIGPGVGCLTAELARRAGKVLALEVDGRLMPVLKETVGEWENVTVLNADVMDTDLAALTAAYFPGLSPVVCANLPYNITSPVLVKLIGSGLFETVTVMVQREVARRICAAPGTEEYGAFGIFVNFYTKPSLLFDVPPDCFAPRPKVTSSVVRLQRRDCPAVQTDEALFFKIVRAAFNQRRKTLLNALTAAFSDKLDKALIRAAIASAGLPEAVRGEALSIPQFASLTSSIKESLS